MNNGSRRRSNLMREQNSCHWRNGYVQPAGSDLSVTGADSEDDVQTPEEREMIEKTYVAWRMKNADLFNGSKLDTSRIPSRPADSRERITLLHRINEISDRLEKDGIDTDSARNIPIRNSELKDCNNGNDTDAASNLSLREFERIEALYNKVFSSDKPNLPVVSSKYDQNNTMTHRSNYGNTLRLQDDVIDEIHHQTMRNQSPKKFVSFEHNDDDRNGVLNKRYTRDYLQDIPNEGITSQLNQTGCKPLNKHKKTPYQSVTHCSLNKYPYSSDKDESDTLMLPISRCNKPNKTCNEISRKEARKTYPLKQRALKQYKCDAITYECSQGCHHCNEIPKDRFRNGMKHGSDNSNRDELVDSSSEDYVQSDSHNRTGYKSRKKNKITIDELYKIVKLQNEQITLLQKQIDRLLEQNAIIKNESRLQKMQEQEPVAKVEETTEEACTCQQHKCDKLSSEGFTVSVVQENSKIGHKLQHYDRLIDGNNVQKNSTNVSIGVMTSFVEITQKRHSLTTQHNTVPNSEHKCNSKFAVNPKPYNKQYSMKAVTDSEKRMSCSAVAEESITLNEVDLPVVNEHVPSPDCSLHLDIQDYGSTTTPTSSTSSSNSDSEYKSDEMDNKHESHSDHEQVGWTLYNNVVSQLNKILRPNGTNQAGKHELPSSDDVRTATIQQLKKLGVSFMENDNKQVSFDSNPRFGNFLHKDEVHNDPGTNRELEQVPMQYLNEDQILQAAMDIMNKRKETRSADYAKAQPIPNNVGNALNGNTDLSFATMKYMQRYRLLPEADNKDDVNTGGNRRHPSGNQVKNRKLKQSSVRQKKHQRHPQLQYNEQRPQNLLSNKILDITALKQQPKLL